MQYTLVGEPTRWYTVYPSWAELSYRWEDLPRLFADPLASRYFQGREKDINYFLSLGFPSEIKPCKLIDGPCGGGIVSEERVPRGKWLPGFILTKEANNCSPNAMRLAMDTLPFCVSYLEPFDDRLRDYLRGKKRTKLYLCSPTPEHIEADPKGIYWVVGVKKGRRKLEALEHLPEWAKAFGLEVTSLPTMPEILREEISSWFTTPDVEFRWFTVHGGGNGAGYHYAVVLYFSLHLRFVIGPRMKYMHLLASIEGKPRVRVNWPNK
jgi:hypothetical protein